MSKDTDWDGAAAEDTDEGDLTTTTEDGLEQTDPDREEPDFGLTERLPLSKSVDSDERTDDETAVARQRPVGNGGEISVTDMTVVDPGIFGRMEDASAQSSSPGAPQENVAQREGTPTLPVPPPEERSELNDLTAPDPRKHDATESLGPRTLTPVQAEVQASEDSPSGSASLAVTESGSHELDLAGAAWDDLNTSSDWLPSVAQRARDKSPPNDTPEPRYGDRRTNVYGPEGSRPDDPGLRLVVLAGEMQGREFPLRQRQTCVGRAPENDIVLDDPSVSREHAVFLREGIACELKDLDSANGTFINRKRISTGTLSSCDEVSFGQVRMRFLEVGDVFEPVDRRGEPVLPGADARGGLTDRMRRPRAFLTILAMVLGGSTLMAFAVVMTALHAKNGDQVDNPKLAFEYFLRGQKAFKGRHWDQAHTYLSIALQLDPTNERARRHLRQVVKERQHHRDLQAARRHHAAGDLRRVYALAKSIRESVYEPVAADLCQAVEAELDARVARARTSLAAGRPETALELLTSVAQAQPKREDVSALMKRASDLLRRGAAPPPAPAPRSKTRSEPPEPEAETKEITAAKMRFAREDLSGALALLASAPGSDETASLRSDIETFQQTFESALVEHRAKRSTTAIRLLRHARAYAAKITSPPGPIFERIDAKLADMIYLNGIQAFLAGSLPEAYTHFRTALEHAPKHRPSLAKVEELAVKAAEHFDKGELVYSSDEQAARAHWELVLQIVAPGHPLYMRARKRLEDLAASDSSEPTR